MSTIPYDKDAVIADLAERKLRPAQIAEKYGLTVGNVYQIRSGARRAGILNSYGSKSILERLKDEGSVFNPELRERIKDLREEELTSTEISALLTKEGQFAPVDMVRLVMARSTSTLASKPGLGKRWGTTR